MADELQVLGRATLGCLLNLGSRLGGDMVSGTSGRTGITLAQRMMSLKFASTPPRRLGRQVIPSRLFTPMFPPENTLHWSWHEHL